jgi:hypothetical protein
MIRCRTCQRIKEKKDFYLQSGGSRNRNGVKTFKSCIPCTAKNIAEQKRKIYEWVDNYKTSIGCEHCGIQDNRCLQLHHRETETKKHSVAKLIGKGYVFKTVKTEVEKCEVLCANCHSIHHHEERRSGNWGAGKYINQEEVQEECTPIVEQLELFLNFVEE